MSVEELETAFAEHQIHLSDKRLIKQCHGLSVRFSLSPSELAEDMEFYLLQQDQKKFTPSLLKAYDAKLAAHHGTEGQRAKQRAKSKAESSSSSSSSSSSKPSFTYNSRAPKEVSLDSVLASLTPENVLAKAKSQRKKKGKQQRQQDVNSPDGMGGSPGSMAFATPSKGSYRRHVAGTPMQRSFRTFSPATKASPPNSAYSARKNVGQVMVRFNEQLPRVGPTGDSASRVLDMGSGDGDVDMDVEGGEETTPTSKAAFFEMIGEGYQLDDIEPFTYMHVVDADRVDALDMRLEQLSETTHSAVQALATSIQSASAAEDAAQASSAQRVLPTAADAGGQAEEDEDGDEVMEGAEKQEPAQSTEVALAPINVPSQEPVFVVGRVCCDGEGRMKAGLVSLEGRRGVSGGARVKLDLTQSGPISLFPGQIAAFYGVNPSGRELIVKQCLHPTPAPRYAMIPDEMKRRPTRVCVAAGPFTVNTDLEYHPIRDLLRKVAVDKPDVLVLLGPFVDESNQVVRDEAMTLKGSYQDVFTEVINLVAQEVRYLPDMRVFVLPSVKDVHHDCVFPQPPFALNPEVKDAITFLPNPAVFRLGGVTFGMTSDDLLEGMSQLEFSNIKAGRMTRLVNHMLHQQSFCPLFPAPTDFPVDPTRASAMQLPVTPDVMVLPASRLRQFVRQCDEGVVAINPGRLTKFGSGGTYANIVVHASSSSEQPAAERTAVDVVKV